jgi:hypothetical protein
VTVIPFSATRRIGIEQAETLIGEWLDVTVESIAAQESKEKAPRSRGVSRGPKRLA